GCAGSIGPFANFDDIAVGVAKEYLSVSEIWQTPLNEFNLVLLEHTDRFLDSVTAKCEVPAPGVDGCRFRQVVLVVNQVNHHAHAIPLEPASVEGKCGAGHNMKPQHAAVKSLGTLDVPGRHGDVIDSSQRNHQSVLFLSS